MRVPSVSSTKRRVSDAIPQSRPSRLSATRSPVRIARARPLDHGERRPGRRRPRCPPRASPRPRPPGRARGRRRPRPGRRRRRRAPRAGARRGSARPPARARAVVASPLADVLGERGGDDAVDVLLRQLHRSSTGSRPGRTTRCPASASLSTGKSSRKWTPRLSSRASAHAAIESRTSGCGASSSRLSPRALRISPASRQSAAPPGSASPRRCHVGVVEARGRRARPAPARRPKTRHSSSEFEASRFAPWTPVQAHSPAAYSPGTDGAPVEVGDDAADRVVGGGGDGDRLVRRVVARLRERRHQGRDSGRARSAAGRGAPRRARRPRARRRRAARARRRSARRRRRAASRRRRGAPRRAGSRRGRCRRAAPSGGTGRTRDRRASAPAACASRRPSPIAPRGFVVRDQSAA